MKTYRWATLGCGVIANQLAQAMQKEGRKLYGVANRTHAKAVAFAEKYGVQKVYGSIQESDRELANLLEIRDHYPKYIVTLDELAAGSNINGVRIVHLADFLLRKEY